MEKIYNLVTVLKTEKEDLKKEQEIIEVIKEKGEYLDHRSIGEQDLAYEIDDQTKAHYFWVDFDASSKQLEEIKSAIEKLSPLRFLVSKKPKEAVEKRKAQLKEEAAGQKSQSTKKKAKTITKKDKAEDKTSSSKKKKEAKKKTESPADEKKKIEDLDKKLKEIL